jgi:hypothetical protein
MRFWAGALVASLMLLGAEATAQTASPLEGGAIEDAMACGRRMATRLEPSGESAEAIGRAAYWACLNETAPAVNYAFRHPERGITPVAVQQNVESAATAQVVYVRLCRRNGDCDFASTARQ